MKKLINKVYGSAKQKFVSTNKYPTATILQSSKELIVEATKQEGANDEAMILVKKVLNKLYALIKSKFTEGQTYQGSQVLETLRACMKETTENLLKTIEEPQSKPKSPQKSSEKRSSAYSFDRILKNVCTQVHSELQSKFKNDSDYQTTVVLNAVKEAIKSACAPFAEHEKLSEIQSHLSSVYTRLKGKLKQPQYKGQQILAVIKRVILDSTTSVIKTQEEEEKSPTESLTSSQGGETKPEGETSLFGNWGDWDSFNTSLQSGWSDFTNSIGAMDLTVNWDQIKIPTMSFNFDLPMNCTTLLELEKIPLTDAQWKPDTDNCQGCKVPFSTMIRRHHCRNCGLCFCDQCDDWVYMKEDPNKPQPETTGDEKPPERVPQRVCNACIEKCPAAIKALVALKTEHRSMPVFLAPHWPISKIKRVISRKKDVPFQYQRIIFDGKILTDDQTVEDCKIVSGSTLELHVKLVATGNSVTIGGTTAPVHPELAMAYHIHERAKKRGDDKS